MLFLQSILILWKTFQILALFYLFLSNLTKTTSLACRILFWSHFINKRQMWSNKIWEKVIEKHQKKGKGYSSTKEKQQEDCFSSDVFQDEARILTYKLYVLIFQNGPWSESNEKKTSGYISTNILVQMDAWIVFSVSYENLFKIHVSTYKWYSSGAFF